MTPFDLLEEFPARGRMAFVGNAPSLNSSRLGPVIDGCDVVVRFNNGETAGFEAEVGGKTDILCTHHKFGRMGERPLGPDQVRCLAVINNCFTNDLDEEAFWRAAGGNDVFFSFSPSLGRLPDPAHTRGLTTGTQAVQLLGKFLQPSEVVVAGFTLFLDQAASDHYWEERYDAHARNAKHHEFARERQIFCQVLNGLACRVSAAPDVADIYADAAIGPGDKVRFVGWDGAVLPSPPPPDLGDGGRALPT